MPPNRVDRLPLSLLSSPAMDRLHLFVASQTATVAVGGARVSGSPVVPFGPRFWWYDVHQVEGAV
jgi:hypothetical protein